MGTWSPLPTCAQLVKQCDQIGLAPTGREAIWPEIACQARAGILFASHRSTDLLGLRLLQVGRTETKISDPDSALNNLY
jgi:hypothetical protein